MVILKMAVNLYRLALGDSNNLKTIQFVRHAHRMRGKPPTIAKTLQQKLAERNKKDELYSVRIDIGLPLERISRIDNLKQQIQHLRKIRADEEMEKLARHQKLFVDLEDVNKEWLKNKGPHHIKKIAEHYGIYEHLFEEGYFYCQVHLNILFPYGDKLTPVYYGNVVKPIEAQTPPNVCYDADDNSLWTLTLINLDGNFSDDSGEYIHWCVTNIPGNDLSKGNTVVEYLQPIPPKGTGFHRYVFVLYKQDKNINFDMNPVKQLDPLVNRSFKTRDWYKKYQDEMTPAGLAFFQSDWDPTLRDFFHHKLNMKEPVFEYDFPKPYLKPQKWFPKKEAFNLYMDRYRDPKDLNKGYLLLKLKTEHPFMKPEPPLKFPNAQRLPHDMPSWQKLQVKKNRMGWGRINEVA